MIFGRKKKSAEKADEIEEALEQDVDLDADETGSDDVEDADPDDVDADDSESDEADAWREFDLSKDWRADGPFDIDEVDLVDDEANRLDLGSLIITPIPGSELRLQMSEPKKEIVSALMISGQSAMEISVFAAPRTPGMWADVRAELIEQTTSTGGVAECAEGPFGTELRRRMRVQLPDGKTGIQPSRMWVAEGPRWFLRGILFGPTSVSEEWDDDLVGPFFDAFSDLIVRRGEDPRPSGEVLALHVPDELKEQAAAQQLAAQQEAAKKDETKDDGPIGEGGVMGVARQG
ncbi:DUF3710 domain-containing protein [Propioniferax innocua]|uniref:Uncharacterized protein DUF3710 n=1 Tax=Propioniferax innocua TaxID=1753 RepID=A0A542ZQI1_9ACTN|nr:DUF3710 domain-containing protein [Propioniferax innocua]TQL62615.1 uncharacterized protein DUF3710 [Propioniferax innocua]